jgi:peptidoglycan hydrolase CwlO-like protein
VALSLCSVPFSQTAATAVTLDETQAAVDSAQSSLDAAEVKMAEITAQYNEAQDALTTLNSQIDESIANVMDAQQAMLDGREALGDVAQYEYRSNLTSGLIDLILDSKNFSDLLQNIECVKRILTYKADELERQQMLVEQFKAASETLTQQKDQQEQVLAQLEQAQTDAQALVASAESQLTSAQDAHAAQVEALRQAAEALAAQQAQEEAAQEVDASATTTNRQDVVPDSTPVI